jgi:transposase, IS30 family
MEMITQQQINEVMFQLNNRPRKRFGIKIPNQVFLDKNINVAHTSLIHMMFLSLNIFSILLVK